MQLVLQESQALQYWNPGERFERSEPYSFKLAIQDAKTFPSLQENTVRLSAGAMHTISVIRFLS